MQLVLRPSLARIIVFVLLVAPGIVAGAWFVNQYAFAAISSQQESVELVIIDAPDGFERHASLLGFKIESKSVLKELDITALHISAPEGLSAAKARNILIAAFPSLVVEMNSEDGAFKTSAEESFTGK